MIAASRSCARRSLQLALASPAPETAAAAAAVATRRSLVAVSTGRRCCYLVPPIRAASNRRNGVADERFAWRTSSTAASPPPPGSSSVIEAKWNTYLASGRGSQDLFDSIVAIDGTDRITASEVRKFLDSVGRKGVHARAFAKLELLADDHRLSLDEFREWLAWATEYPPTGEQNVRLQESYKDHPHRGVSKKELLEDGALIVEPPWNASTMNQAVRRMQYAVRGSVVMKAEQLQADGRDVLFTNVGNPQAVGQPPMTYFRQVLSLTDLPPEHGVDHPNVASVFPPDVVERAKQIHASIGIPAGTGAYTGSQGVLDFRKDVANYIERRDGGHEAYAGNIFLTNGASSAIDLVLTTLIASDKDAVMIPIPQYPIYSALIARLMGRQVGYYLKEDDGWSIDEKELESKLSGAHSDGLHVKAVVIINPGNPTGQVLTRKDLETICSFCAKHQIVLMSDEVYQRNVYAPEKEFISAKRVAVETPGCEKLQLISFHSTSKGLIGECGRRGGYMELHNIDAFVQSQLYKLASSGLCSNVPGQVLTSLMVVPPQPGDASYDLFAEEESTIYDGLKFRAKAVVDGLNAIDGITCQPAEGAMYAFPAIQIPDGALKQASEEDMTPDTLYALSLLEETGICVVPASGFGQEEGRFGFRTTFLPPKDKLLAAIDGFADHHKMFCEKYS